MKAIVSGSSSEPKAVLAELPEPRALPSEALVEVRAISLNRGEVRSLPDRDPQRPNGWDLAGVVREGAADGSGPGPGARVVGLVSPQGAWAQLAAVPVKTLAELPDAVSFEDAATLPVAGLTALRTLERAGFVLADDVAILGASGGVGRFAIQLAKAAGARVTAVARRREGLHELGADVVEQELAGEGPRFRAILDGIGGPVLGRAVERIAPGGTIVSFASTIFEDVRYPPRALFAGAPGASIYGFMLFPELVRNGDSGSHDLGRLAELVAAGRLRTSIDLVLPFDRAQEAVDALLGGDVRGKAVLTL